MPEWDEIFSKEGHVFKEPHPDMNKLVSLFTENGVKNILDVGCGTGRHLVYLSKKGFEVTGFDASPKAIDLAKKWLETESLEAEVSIHRMEDSFPYSENTFDAVISIQTLHHNLMTNIRTTIDEISRVLRPKGIIFITVPTFQSGPVPPERDWGLRQVEDGTYIPEKGPESGIPHHYFSCNELIVEFREFEPIEIYIDETNHRVFIGIKRSHSLVDEVEKAIKQNIDLLQEAGIAVDDVSSNEVVEYFSGETPTGDKTTLYDIIRNKWLLLHEIVELKRLKDIGHKITSNLIWDNYYDVLSAHVFATKQEFRIALKHDAKEWVSERVVMISTWLEGPGLPEIIRDEFIALQEAYSSSE